MLGVCPVKRRERPDGKATQLGGRWETPPEVGGRLGFVETERGRWRVARSVLLDVSTHAAGIAGGIGETQRPPSGARSSSTGHTQAIEDRRPTQCGAQ